MGNVEEDTQVVTQSRPAYVNDHEVRRRAILNTNYIIENRQDYLEAVKVANEAFRIGQGRVWMQYVRDVNRKPYGLVVISKNVNGQAVITGSILHGGDKWDRNLSFFYATQRAKLATINLETGEFDGKLLPKKCHDTAKILIAEYLAKHRV